VVFLDPNTSRARNAITYPGMLDALKLQDGDVSREDRLFESEYYAWDPFCDLDKFSNYSQYYWLPSGPNAVDVSATEVLLTEDYTVTRATNAYQFSGTAGNNPIITLARGGNYTFTVDQPGYNFWIQSKPGVNGRLPATPNISSRDVYGVVNNGADQGTVEFYVPLNTAQDFYYSLPELAPVDLITTLKFNQINNIYVSAFQAQYPDGIDGITNLAGRTVIFINNIQDAEDGGWEVTTQYDPLPSNAVPGTFGTYDSITFDQTTPLTLLSQRYSVWRINYVEDTDGNYYMQLESLYEVPELSKFRIQYGTQYSSTQWYKNAIGYYEQVPLLTATLDVLYYQDSSNPANFGEIRLVDPDVSAPIDINEIIGAKNYTSPNGVVFTNGLKVQFRGLTTPAEFQNLEYYVEGVGTGLGLTARVGFIDGEAYFGAFHVVDGQKITGLADTTVFQQYIYDTVEESIINRGVGGPASYPLPQSSVPGAIQGNGIKLIPVRELVTPETYTDSALSPYDFLPYDEGSYDAILNAPLIPDYLTQNRASNSRNAWSRSNRWFHIDVINYSAELNNTTAVINNSQRAKRPIIEFRANLHLWDTGTQAKQPVNIIDFYQTDAFSNVNGQLGYGIDGYQFLAGTRVIFAADLDPDVRNRIYEVKLIDPSDSGTFVIDLVATPDSVPLYNQMVVSLNGLTQQGKSFWFDGITWQLAQEKNSVNQAPLFNVYDKNGFSFNNQNVYPSTTFQGSRLFGYTDSDAIRVDDVLGFPLSFLNINNVGDILFSNYFYTDTFIYVRDRISNTVNISNGFAREYIDRVSFSDDLGWQTAAAKNRSRQVFRFTYSGVPLELDVPVLTESVFAPIQLYAEGVFIDPTNYLVEVTDTSTYITFVDTVPVDAIIEVRVISNVASLVGFYQVPLNLENNAPNKNSNQFTLGTIRAHYDTIGQNLKDVVGPINGSNNIRDLGNVIPYGTNIVQNSAPAILPGVYLREPEFDIFNSLAFNNQEYTKYKTRLLDAAGRGDYVNSTPTQILDSVVQELTLGKTEAFPFYWSDMLPSSETYTEINYTYSFTSRNVFDVNRIYDFTSSNFQSLLVYLNGNILTRGYDYTVSTDSATVIVTTDLAIGDTITIREYNSTYGSFVPNTPTKMGLYPAFTPAIYLDETYVNPTQVIRGHDGSITVAFGDFRDDVLLEFETRIFNNLKIVSPIPLDSSDVIPGQFRTTDYTLDEINNILLPDFLSWVGWNKLNYTQQDYQANNQFTYNYSQSSDRLTGEPLLGAWRGIYNYFYDTITPNTTPWEMLGFSQEPSWWQEVYGPMPYTSGNLVLWRDLQAGFIADPNNPRFDARYARPDLLRVIPSSNEGELLGPLEATVGNYDSTSFRRSWAFGDDGPVESAWRTSSAWPFAVMRLLALTKPAEFFSLFVDRDRYVYSEELNQYLWDERYRLEASNITPLYGNGVSKASYINWIIDYNQQQGLDSSSNLTRTLANLDVRLCWRMAAFSDKQYLKIYSERSTPSGTNASLLLPDESYQVLLYQNTPFDQLSYSAVVVQNTDDGWAVYGYDSLASYFEIVASKPQGKTFTISAGGTSVKVPAEYTNTIVRVPYGFVFTNAEALCDFLCSYGQYLSQRGMTFEGVENGYVMNWTQMAQEFLYWSGQGWVSGSLVNLNPAATQISIVKPGAVVESLFPPRLDNLVLNQNRQVIPPSELVIDRLENTFRITTTTANAINFLNLRFTAYENMVIVDNRSIFADLIYDPITGARQSRLLVSGWLSGDWNGTVNAPGFVLNQDNVEEWRPNQKYTKGEIVLFKDQYWSASTIIKPSAEFNFSLWIKSDYGQIQKGLLPNAANSSDQLAMSYSTYNANLEKEVDIFSYGLIGFRPRQYMQALNLDDVSQVNLYQQFLGTKGTIRATNLFSLANLGKEIAEYNLYEYWAILRSTYGANANRSYFELLLNEAKLTSDPSLIQVIAPEQQSQADQTVYVSDIWQSSYKLTSPNILPTTTIPVTDIGLPSAGYVSLEDVDITVFDLADSTNIETTLATVGVGTTIWVARVNTYDWDVYRVDLVPGRITRIEDNLNSTAVATFTRAHGLAVDDTLIIKNFSTQVNGVYRVLSVPSIYTVLIDYQFPDFETFFVGQGLGFTLVTNRVAQPSDIPSLSYADQLTPGIKVWVDNNGKDRWTVLEKIEPFTADITLVPIDPVATSLFGTSVAQGLFNLTAMVGAPGNSVDFAGSVYTFVRTDKDQYEQNSILQLNAVDVVGYGNQLDIGNQTWGVAAASASNNGQGYVTPIYVAPGSNVFEQRQLLLPHNNEAGAQYGTGVTISEDERWMYIGAPGVNKVFAYTRVDVQQQLVSYITDGSTIEYNWSNSLVIDYTKPAQLVVVFNGQALIYGTDYTVNSTSIVLTTVPLADRKLIIVRRLETQLDQQTYYNVTQSSTSGLGENAEFTVNRLRGVYTISIESGGVAYQVGDTITINATVIGGGTVPANNLTITVDAVDGNNAIVLCSTSGSGVNNTASFDLSTTLATVVADDIYSFTVRVNEQLFRPNIDYTFAGTTVTFTNPTSSGDGAVPPGATILVNSTGYYDWVETLEIPGIDADAQFGYSVVCNTTGSQVLVSAPTSNITVGSDSYTSAGKSYVFDRSIQRFYVTDASITAYEPIELATSPGFVAVSVNGEFLTTTDLNIGGTFTVNSPYVDITAPLAVGDVIQIETNQFSLVEVLESAEPSAAAQFGWKVDQCIYDCSLYLSAPYDSTVLPEAGKVETFRNQTRLYGSITSTIANPQNLTVGDYIRINNVYVELTAENTGDLTASVAQLAANINAANIPNVIATVTEDLVLDGDGTTQVFDVGTIYSVAESYTTKVYIGPSLDDLTEVTSGYNYNNDTQQITFTVAPYKTSKILVVSGRIIITVKNLEAAQDYNKLLVLPGPDSLFDDLGLYVYAWQQLIVSPVPQSSAHFGEGLFISSDALTLLVGAPGGTMLQPTTFDAGATYFDSESTNFVDGASQTGVVYSYDLLPAANSSVDNPAKFVFGQQFVNTTLGALDNFGAAIDYTTGVLLIGAPGSDIGDSSLANFGQVLQYHNFNLSPAWIPTRVQEPSVDVSLLNTVFMFDRVSGEPRQYFDYFDPLQGRLLGVVQQNIDYIGAVDPAAYNVGLVNNYGQLWAQGRVGQIWWNTNRTRFIDPLQNDIVYASRRWGQLFPDSSVDVYQWIVSEVPPAEYAGPGTPYSTDSYVISSSVNLEGFLVTQYYFWVTGIVTVDSTAGKTLSIDTITRYIESPRSSGISYIAPINASTLAIYNGLQYISALDTVLYVEYDRKATDDAVHVEYQLIGQDRPADFLNDTLYKKLLDSLSGADIAGYAVPDPLLSPSQRYGIEFRPRQSMFANRFLALKNYIQQSNLVLAQFPICEIRPFTLLNSSEPTPAATSGTWNKRVANYEELLYQDLPEVPIGYRYLVDSDSTNNGFWTIYEVIEGVGIEGRTLGLVRVQNYDTKLYWNRVNWYRTGYDPLTRIVTEVPNVAALDTITVPNGSSVEVTANSQNKWEIYLYQNNAWSRVGLQDGTIEISSKIWDYAAGRFGFDSEVFDAQYFDQSPVIETRKILEALNQELFTGELLIERNRLLILMFNFILSEQQAPDWLLKTSLIDVDHVIRNLVPYQVYRRDNQDFVLDYINEVKPYHVQIREFNLKYQGLDVFQGSMTDFDLPAYYDTAQGMFISPVLDNTGTLSTTSSRPSTDPIWQTFPWNQWYQNYLLSIDSVTIATAGTGYISPPEVVVTGDCTRQAVMTSQINSAGQLVNIIVVDPGAGYSTTAIIALIGGGGSGAQAVAVMGNTMVRNLLTVIRYDRYQYAPTVVEWQADVIYPVGSQVRYSDRVWTNTVQLQTSSFDPLDWTQVPAGDLSGVNRTMGYYVPGPNQPGLDLSQLISGVDYPGVQVFAPTFDQNTGFDVGNFDINPYDNISYGPDGTPSYDPAILDAIYESSFLDPYLGTRPTDINVDGGAFVDTYESHAPEELVPGITYDTLDIRVFTTPGSDWTGQGHGFPLADTNYSFDADSPYLNFSNIIINPVSIMVYNHTTGNMLSLGADYTVDWVNYIVTVNNYASPGDVMSISAAGLGGGNQLYTHSYVGSDLIDNTVIVPLSYSLIQDFAVFVNGTVTTDYTSLSVGAGLTAVEFGTTYGASDRITLTALGTPITEIGSGWSAPQTQVFISDGSLNYTLTNSLEGTNPANAIVNKNGNRARPPADIRYVADGSTVEYYLPTRGEYSLNLVADNDVAVWVNNHAQILGVEFSVNLPDDSTNRAITFATAPAEGSVVLISVRTEAQYWIVGNQLSFRPGQGLIPVAGDVISVTTWNDTSEQDLVTQVFVGPNSSGIVIGQPYDTTGYDIGTTNFAAGSFDYTEGVPIENNNFDIGLIIIDPQRLVVTLDGRYLEPNTEFTYSGSVVTIPGAPINAAQEVYITSMTQYVVPQSMAFRVFQDMRGIQSVYRITPNTSTTLAASLLAVDDIIYVEDASKLSPPDLTQGIFGLITINGERIAYRNINTNANTVSGLRRGTAGTGAADHLLGADVYDIGRGNLLPAEYQNYTQQQSFLGDGSTVEFTTDDIDVSMIDSTENAEAVIVYVGGILQTSGYTVSADNPVAVTFDTAPGDGYQVTIEVNRGVTWYAPGSGTPSDGVPLQDTNTFPARFLRGE
jgi:hypothetical protein